MKFVYILLMLLIVEVTSVMPQRIMLENFERGLGQFDAHVGHSGTVGVIHTAPRLDPTTQAKDGNLCLLIPLIDNDTTDDDWYARVLCGEGTPSNNVKLDSIGYIGFWMKTNNHFLRVHIMVDSPSDPLGTERCDPLPVIGDGQWHQYEFNLENSAIWHPWGGPSANGKIEKPTTLDCIVIGANAADVNGDTVYVWMDVVEYNSAGPVSDVETVSNQPVSYSLSQNYPNPFNPNTTITFSMPEAGLADLSVYNVLGQKVAELVSGFMESGEHNIDFNAAELASGTYIYRLNVNGNVLSRKLVLLK